MLESAPDLTIRRLASEDRGALERLSQRDSSATPEGPVLAAVAPGGTLVAAISLQSHEVVADPFLPSEHAVGTLRMRARQLSIESRPPRPRRRWRRRRAHAALPGSPPGAGGRLLALTGLRPPN